MKPGWIPYKWFWALGGTLALLSIGFISMGSAVTAASLGFAATVFVILGFVERHRGAPPI
jgi:hypothetical protein